MVADFFRELDRQGPAAMEQTLRALEFVPDRPGDADRRHRMRHRRTDRHDRRNRDCTITAVDLLPELLEEFRARIKKAGLENRVTAIQGSMDALPFSPGEFDVIWAEGSIYNIGFERGLREWRQYLKPGGIIAVTECSWLSAHAWRRNSSRTISPTSTARRGKCGSSKRRDMHRWRISRCPSIAGRKTTSPMQAHASRDSSSNTGTVKKHSAGPKCRKTRSPITKNTKRTTVTSSTSAKNRKSNPSS